MFSLWNTHSLPCSPHWAPAVPALDNSVCNAFAENIQSCNATACFVDLSLRDFYSISQGKWHSNYVARSVRNTLYGSLRGTIALWLRLSRSVRPDQWRTNHIERYFSTLAERCSPWKLLRQAQASIALFAVPLLRNSRYEGLTICLVERLAAPTSATSDWSKGNQSSSRDLSATLSLRALSISSPTELRPHGGTLPRCESTQRYPSSCHEFGQHFP